MVFGKDDWDCSGDYSSVSLLVRSVLVVAAFLCANCFSEPLRRTVLLCYDITGATRSDIFAAWHSPRYSINGRTGGFQAEPVDLR